MKRNLNLSHTRNDLNINKDFRWRLPEKEGFRSWCLLPLPNNAYISSFTKYLLNLIRIDSKGKSVFYLNQLLSGRAQSGQCIIRPTFCLNQFYLEVVETRSCLILVQFNRIRIHARTNLVCNNFTWNVYDVDRVLSVIR